MTKRLQVLVDDREYREIQRASRAARQSIADWVRGSMRAMLSRGRTRSPDERLATIMAFARHRAPIGDIDALLEEIERGRGA